jgi:hypothetical protein
MNLLEQAAKAERLARSITDVRTVEAFTRYARECREKAEKIAPSQASYHQTPAPRWAPARAAFGDIHGDRPKDPA